MIIINGAIQMLFKYFYNNFWRFLAIFDDFGDFGESGRKRRLIKLLIYI